MLDQLMPLDCVQEAAHLVWFELAEAGDVAAQQVLGKRQSFVAVEAYLVDQQEQLALLIALRSAFAHARERSVSLP